MTTPPFLSDGRFLALIDSGPLPSVDLLVLDTHRGRDRVLLGRRMNRPAQGFWFVPGGRIRKNESLDGAMRRVAATELGVEVERKAARLLGAYDHFYPDNTFGVEGVTTHYVALGYLVRLPEGAQPHVDDQHEGFRWWDVEEALVSDQVHEHTKYYLQAL